MMVQLEYRHSDLTGLPEDLSAKEIWEVARLVRMQISSNRSERELPLETLVPDLQRWTVNGIGFEVDWDLEHKVANRAGKPVMGVTEYDKASPTCVMVSVNGPKLANDTLLRSTVAHELGHVVFDGPGWVLAAPEQPVQTSFTGKASVRDPREVRANEFMGALLVPVSLLRVDLQRLAKQHRFPASRLPSTVVANAQAYDASRLDFDAVTDVTFALAERYGVSESFMRVRLDRYDLLRHQQFAH